MKKLKIKKNLQNFKKKKTSSKRKSGRFKNFALTSIMIQQSYIIKRQLFYMIKMG